MIKALVDQNGATLAGLVLRLAMGANLLGHGLVRMGSKYYVFQEWITELFRGSFLPAPLVQITGYVIPPAELILGVFILVGWKTKLSLLAASLLMCLLIFGMCLVEKWEIVGLQMVYIICYYLLLTSAEKQIFSIDSFLKEGAK